MQIVKGADYDTAPQAEIRVAQDVLRAARPSSGGTKRTELIPSANGGGYETVSASELRAAEAQTRAQSNIPIGQHVPEEGGGGGSYLEAESGTAAGTVTRKQLQSDV